MKYDSADIVMGVLCTLSLFMLPIYDASCTPQQGAVTADVLQTACDVGSVLVFGPNPADLPLCADIPLIEQIIAGWSSGTARKMTAPDLYAAIKASGKGRPVRVK